MSLKFRGNDVGIIELLILVCIFVVFPPLAIYMFLCHIVDYRILKRYYLKQRKWDLNISCGNTDSGGINADVVKRGVPNFVLIEDMYKLPFKDKQFDNVMCSHTVEHLKDPEKFHAELKRVSKNVVFLIPPIWDILAMEEYMEHKWQFISLKIKHANSLPRKFKLPYWGIQEKYGQKLRC